MIPAWFDVGVLTVVTVLLLALAVWRARYLADPAGRNGVAVALFLVPAIAFGWALTVEGRHQWAQREATAVTRALTGVPGAVAVCERFSADLFNPWQNAGHVTSDEPEVAHLRRETCNDLVSWLLSDRHDPTQAQAVAVHVVVHEAMHVTGEYDEGVAECLAMQHDAEAAVLLGADPADARALAELYHASVYPLLRETYHTAACVPDGELDLTPGDGTFP